MTITTTEGHPLDLKDPIWTIAHVAQALHVSVDRAREFTSREDFPGARRLGTSTGRLLWPREEVLTWFAALPSHKASARRRVAAPTVINPPKASTYRPRTTRSPKRGVAA